MFLIYEKLWNTDSLCNTFAVANSEPYCTTTGFPEAYDNVISVGLTDVRSTLPYFSGVGLYLSTRPLT